MKTRSQSTPCARTCSEGLLFTPRRSRMKRKVTSSESLPCEQRGHSEDKETKESGEEVDLKIQPPPYDFPHQKLDSVTLDLGSQPKILKSEYNKTLKRDAILPVKVKDMTFPEVQVYRKQCEFEKKLDDFMKKREIILTEKLKCPRREMGRLRIFVTHEISSADLGGYEWTLMVKGDIVGADGIVIKEHKFSDCFDELKISQSLTLNSEASSLLAHWKREEAEGTTDGFKLQRPWGGPIYLEISFTLHHEQDLFQVDSKLRSLPGITNGVYPFNTVVARVWQYIKTANLQDRFQNEFINCDNLLEFIFGLKRMRFVELGLRLKSLLYVPAPIVIPYVVGFEETLSPQPNCCLVDYEVDAPEQKEIRAYLSKQRAARAELQNLEQTIANGINDIKTAASRLDTLERFADDPQKFLIQFTASMSSELKVMLDVVGNPEEERRAGFYRHAPWLPEAITRYLSPKVQNPMAQ